MQRRFIAEDPSWSLALVAPLSDLCLTTLIKHFAKKPFFKELSPEQKEYLLERLPTSLPLTLTAKLISDGTYWERCCRGRWDLCDVSEYGNSWKRMYLERHMESLIEIYIPQVTDAKDLLDIVPLCKNHIKRLDISQLLTPIKEHHEEEEEEEEEEEREDFKPALEIEQEKVSMHHFNFNILLHKLMYLEELRLVYRIKECGMNFEWSMFEMVDKDADNLGKAIKSCKTLKILRVHLSKVNDTKCRTLVRYLLDHPSLKVLDLSHNQIGDRGARALGKLMGSSQLETLTLYDNKIGDPGAKAIGHALSKNPRLSSLNLALNHVQDNGGEALVSSLMSNRFLLHINLAANELTVQTALALHKVLLRNNTVKAINLSGNDLGEDGGRVLEEAMCYNTSVTQLDVRLTGADAQSTSYILQALLANEGLDEQKNAEKCELEGNIDKNIADLLENMTAQK